MFNLDKVPKIKCGAVPALLGVNAGLSALGIGTSLAASSDTNATNAGIARQQMDLQVAENQKNREFNAEQSAIARAFAASQQSKANQFTTSERESSQAFQSQQWQREAQWNTPTAQSNRLAAAGFNPSVVLSNTPAASFTGSVGAPLGASSPAASVAPASYNSGVVPTGGFAQMPPIANMLQAVGSFARDLSQAEKTGMDTSLLRDTFKSLVKKANLEVEGQSLENSLNKIKLKHEDQILVKKIQLLAEQIVSTNEESFLKKSQIELNNVLEDLNRSLIFKYGEEGRLVALEVGSFGKKLNEQIKLWKSEEVKNYASAEESKASAANINFFNRLREEPGVRESLIKEATQAGQAAVNANKISEKQAKQLDYLISQAAYADDNKEFTYWSNQITNFVGTLGQAASQFYGAGALRELIKVRQIQQQPYISVQGFNR